MTPTDDSLVERIADLFVKFRAEAVSSGDLHYAQTAINEVREHAAREIEAADSRDPAPLPVRAATLRRCARIARGSS